MAVLPESHSLTGARTAVLDGKIGGQQGHLPDPLNWMASDDYIRMPLVAVFIKEPGLMKYMDDGEDRIKQYRAIIEMLPTTITGLTRTLTTTFEESVLSHGDLTHHTPTKTARAKSEVAITVPEKRGLFIANFFTDLMIDLHNDPDTAYPGIINKDAYIAAGSPVISPEGRAAVFLFYEPSPEYNRITNAWLYVNAMPTTSGTIDGELTKGGPTSIVEQSLTFVGTPYVGRNIDALAQRHLDKMNILGMDGLGMAAAYDDVTNSVAAGEGGYVNHVEATAGSAAEN